jgi:hypothetical protein
MKRVIYKNGTYIDADVTWEYENDPDWLVTIQGCGGDTLLKYLEETYAQLQVGIEEGAVCNRRCDGKMVLPPVENCSCHISSPCGACEDNRPMCSSCGEEAE